MELPHCQKFLREKIVVGIKVASPFVQKICNLSFSATFKFCLIRNFLFYDFQKEFCYPCRTILMQFLLLQSFNQSTSNSCNCKLHFFRCKAWIADTVRQSNLKLFPQRFLTMKYLTMNFGAGISFVLVVSRRTDNVTIGPATFYSLLDTKRQL